jgi:hypothetical protein
MSTDLLFHIFLSLLEQVSVIIDLSLVPQEGFVVLLLVLLLIHPNNDHRVLRTDGQLRLVLEDLWVLQQAGVVEGGDVAPPGRRRDLPEDYLAQSLVHDVYTFVFALELDL